MQRLGKLINQRNWQTGGMTIFTAILVLIVLTLMIFYAARVGRMEQNVSANDVRQKLAFHAAEEAVDQGVEYLKANSRLILSNAIDGFADGSGGTTRDGWMVGKWKVCTAGNIADLTHPCGGQFPMQTGSYYYDDATTGFAITGIISAFDAERIRPSSSDCCDTDCRPRTILTSAGKKQIKAAMTTFAVKPLPNISTNIGAIARMGIVREIGTTSVHT